MNDGAVASGSFPTDGTPPTLSGGLQSTTFSYDASADSYTISAGSRTVTFRPANRDTSLSNATVTVYTIKSGNTTDTLTLTNAGTSGRFTFRYVGGGYWQRTVENAATIDGSINAVTYGVATPAAAVPTSGRAEYQVDFIGAMTRGGAPEGFTGAGVLQIDLATGRLTVNGQLGPSGAGSNFQGSASMTSGTGRFSGSFSTYIGGIQPIVGPMQGRFYGPGAEEVGGSFGGASSGAGAGAIVGSFIGRGAAVPNLAFDASRVNSLSASVAATLEGGKVSGTASRTMPLEIRYDAATDTYTLINAERSFSAKPFVETIFAADSDTIKVKDPGLGQQYVKVLQWIDKRQAGTQNRYLLTEAVFGTRTADADVPRSGNAGYQVNFSGTLVENGASDVVRDAGGGGQLFLDFGTGRIDTDGRLFTGLPDGTLFKGTGQLSSSTSSFAGTLATNSGGYTGNWNGALYGPGGAELGSVFTLTNGTGGVLAGTLTGKSNPDMALDTTRLLDLTASKTFMTLAAIRNYTSARTENSPSGPYVVTFNPATRQYDLAVDRFGAGDLHLTPAQLDASKSDATFDRYNTRVSGGSEDNVTAKILRSGSSNPTIQLDYVSFADLTYRSESPPGTTQYFDFSTVFGMNTPILQIPRTGFASYTGIASGGAETFTNAAGINYFAVSGTSQFNFNFSSFEMNGSLALTGVNRASGATRDFGTFAFTGSTPFGNVGPATFYGNFSTISGSITGSFFGPRGPELGAVFAMDRTGGTEEQLWIAGAAVAKRQP